MPTTERCHYTKQQIELKRKLQLTALVRRQDIAWCGMKPARHRALWLSIERPNRFLERRHPSKPPTPPAVPPVSFHPNGTLKSNVFHISIHICPHRNAPIRRSRPVLSPQCSRPPSSPARRAGAGGRAQDPGSGSLCARRAQTRPSRALSESAMPVETRRSCEITRAAHHPACVASRRQRHAANRPRSTPLAASPGRECASVRVGRECSVLTQRRPVAARPGSARRRRRGRRGFGRHP
jgi:hypothetical protein